MRANVFVLGLDAHNERILADMSDAAGCAFHRVLSVDEIYGGTIDFEQLLATAQSRMDEFDGPVDAIIGFWDFPVTSLLPLLRERYGLPTAGLDEVVMCEHKYWSRLIQQRVITEYPRFELVLPESDLTPPDGLQYPLWVKPVKSFSSLLAFAAADDGEFSAAMASIRAGIDWIGEPFEALLKHLVLPPEIASVGGRVCLAEEALTGRQFTVEGYRHRGAVVSYAIVESVRFDNSPSFLRYQYPAELPASVSERFIGITERVVEAIGMEGMTFNIEYFWDPATDAVGLLEINPRHSQSHARIFEDVDGISNHQVMLRLQLGKDPGFHRNKGKYAVAAKWFIRWFSDGIVRSCPTWRQIEAAEQAVAGTTVELAVREGDRLSLLLKQDSYSYHLASVYVGAADETELTAKFDRVMAALPFEIESSC